MTAIAVDVGGLQRYPDQPPAVIRQEARPLRPYRARFLVSGQDFSATTEPIWECEAQRELQAAWLDNNADGLGCQYLSELRRNYRRSR